jgi:hypothetical protein
MGDVMETEVIGYTGDFDSLGNGRLFSYKTEKGMHIGLKFKDLDARQGEPSSAVFFHPRSQYEDKNVSSPFIRSNRWFIGPVQELSGVYLTVWPKDVDAESLNESVRFKEPHSGDIISVKCKLFLLYRDTYTGDAHYINLKEGEATKAPPFDDRNYISFCRWRLIRRHDGIIETLLQFPENTQNSEQQKSRPSP